MKHSSSSSSRNSRDSREPSQRQQRTEKSVVLVTGGYDHTIRFWEATGMCQRDKTLEYRGSQVNQLAITPDKSFLAVAGNPHIRLYDINSHTLNPLLSFDGHTGNVTSVGFQKDRKWLYSGSEDGTVKIWDIRTPGFFQRNYSSPNKSAINTVIVHPNQAELIGGDEKGSLFVWDLTANKCSHRIAPLEEKNAIRSVSLSSNTELLAAATNKGIVYIYRLDKAEKFKLTHKIAAHNGYVLKCLFSPDVNYLATTSSDKTIKIWDCTNNFTLSKVLTGHDGWVWDCAFSADSAYLISGSSDKRAKLWDIKSGR
jgi:G protein beta subunit-like protein